MITNAIRQKIEARFGKPVRYSKDCENLSASIFKACNERISTTTLKRLFGFAKSIEQPRLFTMDVLAAYIGYTNWSSLAASEDKPWLLNEEGAPVIDLEQGGEPDIHLLYHEISMSLAQGAININKVESLCRELGKNSEIFPFIIELIGIAARQKNILFLKKVYELPVVFDEEVQNPVQYYYIGQAMGIMLRNNPDISDELIEPLAANKTAQKYFIEWFVDEDNLLGYYGKLLDAYHQFRNTETQDQLFYFALKYNQAVQYGNHNSQSNWYLKMKALPVTAQINQIPVARFIGICLAEEPDHVFSISSAYYQLIEQYFNRNDYQVEVGFSFYLCRELYKGRRTDWLIQFIKNFIINRQSKSTKTSTHWSSKIENALLIYISVAHFLQGEKKKALQQFRRIDPDFFDPFIYQQLQHDYTAVAEVLQIKNNDQPEK